MSAVIVAKKELRDAIRSRLLVVLTVLFGLFAIAGAVVATQLDVLVPGSGAGSTTQVIFTLRTAATFFVPIIGLVVSYRAIAGERETGSIRYLLGLPHSRRDVLLGNVLGRVGVVAVSVTGGFLIGSVGILLLVGSLAVGTFALFTVLTILLGAVYVCIGTGISAMTRSTTRSAIGAFGLLVVFWLVWDFLGMAIVYIMTGSLPFQIDPPVWYLVYTSVPPSVGYETAGGLFFSDGTGFGTDGSVRYLSEPWFGFGLLGLWALIPLSIGYYRFVTTDL